MTNDLDLFDDAEKDSIKALDAMAKSGYHFRAKFEPLVEKMKALGLSPPTLEELSEIRPREYGHIGNKFSDLMENASNLIQNKQFNEGANKVNEAIDLGADMTDESIAGKNWKEALKTRGGSYAGFGLAGALGGAALDPQSRIRGASIGLATMLFVNWLRRKAKYGKLVNY